MQEQHSAFWDFHQIRYRRTYVQKPLTNHIHYVQQECLILLLLNEEKRYLTFQIYEFVHQEQTKILLPVDYYVILEGLSLSDDAPLDQLKPVV